MAKDIIHEAAKQALINSGWTITHDPFYLKFFGKDLNIDLGAERLIGAEKGTERIAVEIKSFINTSMVYDYHLALGQYLNYMLALQRNAPDRILYLAITVYAYNAFFIDDDVQYSLSYNKINLIVFDENTMQIMYILNH
jgi:XisH protein